MTGSRAYPATPSALPSAPSPAPSPAPSSASAQPLVSARPGAAGCREPRLEANRRTDSILLSIAKPNLITCSAASGTLLAITSWIPSSLLYAPPKAIYYPQETAPPDRWATPATSDVVAHRVQSS